MSRAIRCRFEDSCRGVLDRKLPDPQEMPRLSLCEVSRLAVCKGFRRRKGEEAVAARWATRRLRATGRRGPVPFIPISLYLGVVAIAATSTSSTLRPDRAALAGTSPAWVFDPDHRLDRSSTMASGSVLLSSSQLVQGLRPMMRPLYEVIERSVETAFRASR
jgi:hypothetical protein